MMLHSGSGHVTPLVPLAQGSHKPKVGLAVICRCCSGNSYVQCLLQKRGPMSSSPDKWSFPGGRLEQPGDLEDDGAVGTKRELEEECGGGEPPGLPPLIHIECCKSGKLRQTLYHVYVVDTSMNKEWEHWQPKLKNGKSADIDTSPQSLTIQDQTFPCVEGYCWVDMSILIQECYNLNTTADVSASQLQHGLVRWVQNYGEHILKTLIARSPKLPHPRRYSNSMIPGAGVAGSVGSGAIASTLNGHGGSNGASAAGGIGGRPLRTSNSGGRTNKFGGGRGEGGMLVPPTYLPATSFRPPPAYPILGSPTNVYYGMMPAAALPPTALGQMSPTGASATGGGGSGTAPTAGYPAAAVGHTGLLVQVPPPPSLAVVSTTMGGPSLDSSTSALVAAAAAQQHLQQQQAQGQSNVLYMHPIGIQQQPQQLQGQVTLSGSPIQQKDFVRTQPSSPVSFKAPPPISAIAGEGPGGVGGSEESSISLMGSIQQPSGAGAAAAHLVQTQGLVTMTPIMAASASPSSSQQSLNLGGHHHHHGMHHIPPQHPSQPLQQQLPSTQQQQHQAAAAQLQAHVSATTSSSISSGGIFEHLQQQQQALRPGIVALPPSAYQEHTAVPQQQHQQPPLMAQFHHHLPHHHQGIISTAGGGEGASSGGLVGTTTGTGAPNLPLMPPPSVQPLSLSVMGTGQRSESEPLLPNPPIPPLHPAKHVTSVAAGGSGSMGGASSSSSSSSGGHGGQNQSSRKEIPCKHFLAGTCPFGEKCWFAHLQPIQRGESGVGGGSGDVSRLSSAASGGPLHVQIPHNLWINNPNVLFDFSRVAVASPPHSPLSSSLLSAASGGGVGARPPILPTLVRPRAYYPNFPGQQPLLLVRPPTAGAATTVFPATAAAIAAGSVGVGAAGVAGVQGMAGYPFFHHTGQYPSLQPQVNPILRFNLLSEVTVKQQVDNQEMVVTNITKMITRADHIYVAYGQLIHDFKILFGGNRSFQESSVLCERKVISETISCLHFSKQQSSLMIIGTVVGSIYTWDVRKGAPGGVVTSAHKPESQLPGQQSASITVLIHFATSINSAQVIVAGTKGGHVTWFISQPPQKTYSVLYSDQTSHAPHPIVALQILGGFLITGDRGGTVILWSMQTQQPVIDSKMVAHSISLCNIHVIDSTRFITIGLSSYSEVPPDEGLAPESTTSGNGRSRINEGGAKGLHSGLESVGMTIEGVASNFSQMTMSGLPSSEEHTEVGVASGTASEAVKAAAHHPDFFISIWEFSRPPKLVHSLPVNGVVISSSFNYHLPTGNMFLAAGLQNGTVKIYNVPLPTFMTLTTASELHFSEMMGKDCVHVAVNLSREIPLSANAYIRNPFRDLILTTAWSDGRIMVCQVARQ